MTDTKLLPCPHCGKPAELDTARTYRAMSDGKIGDAVAIYCTTCSADMTFCYADAPGTPREEMIAHMIDEWNRRPAPASGAVVKSLKWAGSSEGTQWAETSIGTFSVDKLRGGPGWMWSGPTGNWSKSLPEDAAKAAAQADYDRRILSALHPAPAVEGWRLVPVEPTGEMESTIAGFVRNRAIPAPTDDNPDAIYFDNGHARHLYRFMLSAAPPPPQEGREVDGWREALKPFALLADEIDRLGHEDDSTSLHRISAADLRFARAALRDGGA